MWGGTKYAASVQAIKRDTRYYKSRWVVEKGRSYSEKGATENQNKRRKAAACNHWGILNRPLRSVDRPAFPNNSLMLVGAMVGSLHREWGVAWAAASTWSLRAQGEDPGCRASQGACKSRRVHTRRGTGRCVRQERTSTPWKSLLLRLAGNRIPASRWPMIRVRGTRRVACPA